MEFTLALELAFEFRLGVVDGTVDAFGMICRADTVAPRINDLHFREPDVLPMAWATCIAPELHLAARVLRVATEKFLDVRKAARQVV